jgi:DNA-binding transcriptional ArsR family regulator
MPEPGDEVTQPPARSVSNLTDPRALRALAHPIRLALLGLLRTEGPLTATKAGERLGESSASASFHLRQLSKYGLVEEAGGGHGRERPWRATAMFTNVPEVTDNPDLAVASNLFRSMIAEHYFANFMKWLELRPDEPPEWQQASTQSDVLIYLTPDELGTLAGQVQQLLDPYVDRLTNPALRPEGSRLVQHIELAFPIDNHPPHLFGDRP